MARASIGRQRRERPLLLAFDDHVDCARKLRRDLARYGSDYDVRIETSARAALAHLGRAPAVALVIAGCWRDPETGIELLREAMALRPSAKRLLLRDWYAWIPADLIQEAGGLGAIDHCTHKPWDPAEVGLHPAVTSLLAEWARANRPRLEVVRVVGEERSRRSHELRDLLDRFGIPCAFHGAASPAGQRTLAAAGVEAETSPVVAFLDGRMLVRPSNAQVVEALGARTRVQRSRYDLAIVGAGPAGLAAAVSASSEGLESVVIEREVPGGQAGSTSLIRNYLGFPRGISGEELATRAYRQAAVFGTDFAFMRSVTALAAEGRDRVLTLCDGSEVRASAVLLATGVAYRRLGDAPLEALVGRGVYYGTARSEAPMLRGRHAVVVGGGNAAGQAALHLARHAERVTLVSRGDSLRRTMSEYLVRELRARPNLDVRVSSWVESGRGVDRLEAVTVRACSGGGSEELPADALFLLIGAEPQVEWLSPALARDQRGFLLTGTELGAGSDRFPFETSMRGVFAAGDVRSGSVQRVASAAGAGAIAIHSVHAYLEETEQAPLVRWAAG
jgi:thioredoxin reductase (NADPH)